MASWGRTVCEGREAGVRSQDVFPRVSVICSMARKPGGRSRLENGEDSPGVRQTLVLGGSF